MGWIGRIGFICWIGWMGGVGWNLWTAWWLALCNWVSNLCTVYRIFFEMISNLKILEIIELLKMVEITEMVRNKLIIMYDFGCCHFYITRLKSKVFSLERLFSKKKKLGKKKIFVRKNFGFWKILGIEKFWFEFFVWTNKICGLKILGPKENLGLEKNFGFK